MKYRVVDSVCLEQRRRSTEWKPFHPKIYDGQPEDSFVHPEPRNEGGECPIQQKSQGRGNIIWKQATQLAGMCEIQMIYLLAILS